MLILLEQISIYMFFILFPMVECYTNWQMKMSLLISNYEEENLPMWGLPQKDIGEKNALAEPKDKVIYKESKLGTEQASFLEDITNSLSSVDNCSEPVNPFIHDKDEDILSMDAWMEDPEPVVVKPQLSASATARIEDYELGEQLWVVEVVGEEKGFLHLSDGSARAWVDMGSFGHFIKGDILSVLVERKSNQHIQVKFVDTLQHCSTDFLIPDEEQELEQLEMATA